MNLSCTLALFVFTAFVHITSASDCDGVDVVGAAAEAARIVRESCPFCDVKEGVFRSGENWTDSKDPCLSYLCDQGQVVEKRVQCTKIEKCPDGNAPFHMAGECCLYCSQSQIEEPTTRFIATLSEWSEWEPCSRSCGSGRRSRSRHCMLPVNSALVVEVNCQGLLREVEFCNTEPCPVDGEWGAWSTWAGCSKTCGNGTTSRQRVCDSPEPAHGGKECQGESAQTKECFEQHCPIDGGWGNWTEWGRCSEECGGGFQLRLRSCDNPTPRHGGKLCVGSFVEERSCNTDPCPVDCEWEEWSEWSTCSASCEGGIESRGRGYKQIVLHGGKKCNGSNFEQRECNQHKCPDACKPNPCFPGVECTTRPERTDVHICGPCPRGLTGDGLTCDGVDECSLANPCALGVNCTDRQFGYVCDECPSGYTSKNSEGLDLDDALKAKQECVNIDECLTLSPCDKHSNCTDTPGSYNCSDCRPGYTGHGSTGCILTDPCLADVHHCAMAEGCINTDSGTYKCECPEGYLGDGEIECVRDRDDDGVPDQPFQKLCQSPPCRKDNCVNVPNADQADSDGDGSGDACDNDFDNDGWEDLEDNCPFVSNPQQADYDKDGRGDVCDNCPDSRNPTQSNLDGDKFGDACDQDIDGDGVRNYMDNCPTVRNRVQHDSDRDGIGDSCDNCKAMSNRDQRDKDMDGIGDVCDTNRDRDNDGVQDGYDNCERIPNSDQLNTDRDAHGDACDNDDDNDGVQDDRDNCPKVKNNDQRDRNGNGIGDACENDCDGDGVPDGEDTAPCNRFITKDSLDQFMVVKLSNPAERQADWVVQKSGSYVVQRKSSDPELLLGSHAYSSYEYNGTMEVRNADEQDDFIGLAFNYQSNQRFMLVTWKKAREVYRDRNPFTATAEAELQVKRIRTRRSKGPYLRNSIWQSAPVFFTSTPLWRKTGGWEEGVKYRWNLRYSSASGCMNLRIEGFDGVAETGCMCDYYSRGGKLGLFTFGQPNIIWSDIKIRQLPDYSTLDLQPRSNEQCANYRNKS